MRKTIRTAALIATSAALLTGVVDGTAQASTHRELNMCWSSRPALPNLGITVSADGPSFRQHHLDSGECRAFHVAPGQYKFVVNNLADVQTALTQGDGTDVCGALPDGTNFWDRGVVAKVRRFNKTYRQVSSQTQFIFFFTPTGVQAAEPTLITNVKANRRTSVSYSIYCHAVEAF